MVRSLENEEDKMNMVTGFQLMRRSETELGALFHAFNQAVARSRPFTPQWADAVWNVNAVLRERKRRADGPALT